MIHIDVETRSTLDLPTHGAYRYAAHPDTDVWCVCWAVGDRPVQTWTPSDPVGTFGAFHVGAFCAWNAQFERLIWERILVPRYGFPEICLERWVCTQAAAAQYGYPPALRDAARVLRVEQKDVEGANLMKKMSRPRSEDPLTWHDHPAQVARMIEYCKQDVVVERAVGRMLRPLPPREQYVYAVDQRINDRGVQLDVPLAEAARDCVEALEQRAADRLLALTGGRVRRATDVMQLSGWLEDRGVNVASVDKESLRDAAQGDLPADVVEVLDIRRENGLSSVKKIHRMLAFADPVDHRMRGMMKYYGAQTGRWSGSGPQPQNFPRGSVQNPEQFIDTVLARDLDTLELFDAPMEIVSSLLRPMLVAAPGRTLKVADYAAIEARVLAWLAGDCELVDAFRAGAKIYERMASAIYGVPEDEVTKNQRMVGKIAILALGYGMGARTFAATVKSWTGHTVSGKFAGDVVQIYREKRRSVVNFWRKCEEAFRAGGRVGSLIFEASGDERTITLPSGRQLLYAQVRIDEGGIECGTWAGNAWRTRKLYGGLIVENIVQAVARDLLAQALVDLDSIGFPVVLHVHDEIVCESLLGDEFYTLATLERIMATPPKWATGLPLAVEGWEGLRYRK